MKDTFKLIGLSKQKSFTLTHIYSDREMFWATTDMPQDRFDALFDYCKGDWSATKYVECEFEKLGADNVPINCKVLSVFEPVKEVKP